jgi:hypothetical protein
MIRYKEHEDGIWRLQTVRFESLQLSQQFNNDDTNLDENSSPVTASPTEFSYIQFETIDSPSVVSLSTTDGIFHPVNSQHSLTTDSENLEEDSYSDDTEEGGCSLGNGIAHSGFQYIVVPCDEQSQEDADSENVQNISRRQRIGSNGENTSGPVKNKRLSVRSHPYQRPSSPSLDVP